MGQITHLGDGNQITHLGEGPSIQRKPEQPAQPEVFSVQLKDGRRIDGIPKGTSKVEIMRKANRYFASRGEPTIDIDGNTIKGPAASKLTRDNMGFWEGMVDLFKSAKAYAATEGNTITNILTNNIDPDKLPDALQFIADLGGVRQEIPMYEKDGTFYGTRTETRKERFERLKKERSKDERMRYHGYIPEEGEEGAIAGEILQEVADPANLIFFLRSQKLNNKWTGRLVQGMGRGLGVESLIEIGERMGTGEDIFTADGEWAARLLTGGVAVPAIEEVAWALGKMGNMTPKKAQATVQKFERHYDKMVKSGVDPKVAVAESLRKAGLSGQQLKQYVEIAGEKKAAWEIRGGQPVYQLITPQDMSRLKITKEVKNIKGGPLMTSRSVPIKPRLKHTGRVSEMSIKVGDDWVYQPTYGDNIMAIASKLTPNFPKEMLGSVNKGGASAYHFFIENLSAGLTRIHPKLGEFIRRFEMDVTGRVFELNKKLKGFAEGMKKLAEPQRIALKKALINGDRDGMVQYMSGVTLKGGANMLENFDKEVKPMFDELFKELEASSAAFGWQPKFRENYFPRFINDIEGFKQAINRMDDTDKGLVASALRKAGVKEVDDLDPWTMADMLNQLMRRADVSVKLGRLGSERARTIKNIKNDNLLKYFYDPIEAAQHYIHQVSHATAQRRFFGNFQKSIKKGDDPIEELDMSNLQDSIGHIMRELLERGELDDAGASEAAKMLSARFGPGEKSMHSATKFAKNLGYMGTLNDFANAIVQLGDVAASAVVNDLRSTFIGFAKSVAEEARRAAIKATGREYTPKIAVNMEQMGLDRAAVEFESMSKISKWTDAVFKLTGFKMIDRIGKNTIMNAALSRYQRLASSPQGLIKLQREIAPIIDDPAARSQVIQDLASGKMSEDVKFLMWNKLSDVQPISLSEVPRAYLENPNGRIFYMLKTFMIKQMNLLKQLSVDQYKKGNYAEGTLGLAKYMGIIAMANGNVENLKRVMKGEEPENVFGDEFFWNMFKNFGFNEYMYDVYVSEGKLGMAAMLTIAPPLTTIDRLADDMIDAKNGEGIWYSKSLPFGGTINTLFEDTTEDTMRRMQREAQEDIAL